MVIEQRDVTRRALRRIPRSRGALSGVLIVLLGAWGALVPFIGHYFDFTYTPDAAWRWTSARGWLEVLPGAAAALGGLMLLWSSSRVVASLGGWLAAAAGAWFAVGLALASVLHLGNPGVPASTHEGLRALETVALFTGLGVVLVFLSAGALGRLSVRSLRDIRVAERTLEHEHTQATWERERPAPADRNTEDRPASHSDTKSGQRESSQPQGSDVVTSAPTAPEPYRGGESVPAEPRTGAHDASVARRMPWTRQS